MRYLFLLFLIIVSCNSQVDDLTILGTWTMDQDTVKYPKGGAMDKITFLENDSLRVDLSWDGKLIEQYIGKYSWNKKEKQLTTEINSEKRQFDIILHTANQISLKDEKNKIIENYKRL